MNYRMKKSIALFAIAALFVGSFPFHAFAGQAPQINTLAGSATGANTATLNGYFNAYGTTTSTWFVYGTSAGALNSQTNPVNQGTGAGGYSASLSGLIPNTTYYFRAVGSNFYGLTNGSTTGSFTTQTGGNQSASLTLQTLPSTNLAATSTTLNGYYTATGVAPILWFQYGTSSAHLNKFSNPVVKTIGAGAWSSDLANLLPDTTYYFRAYGSQNGVVSTASTTGSFTTAHVVQQTMTVQSLPATNITQTSAVLNGYITPNGTTATNRYFKYGTSSSNLSSTLSVAGSQTNAGPFSTTLSGLTANTTYYFKACADNSLGTVCGTTTQSFTTSANGGGGASAPTISASVTNINQNDALLQASTNPNGATTTTWFEWGSSTSLGYTAGTQTIGSGTSSVSTSFTLSGLSAGMTYYFKACASNNAGQNCTTTQSFVTPGNNGGGGGGYGAPSVTTNFVTSIGQNNATLTGYYSSNGSNTYTWFEYGTNYNFGNSTSRVFQGNSSGNFNEYIYNLAANTTYYARACASNSYGQNCGSSVTFTTTGYGGGYGNIAAVTTSATNIGKTFATLNGYVSTSLYSSCSNGTYGCANIGQQYWFEWGATQNLGFQTPTQYTNSGASAQISGLFPGSTYYFRVVANANGSIVRGDLMSFTTLSSDSTVIVDQGGSSASAYLTLSVMPSILTAKTDDTINYTVTYTNTSSRTLHAANLHIMLPSPIDYAGSQMGGWNEMGRSIDATLGDIAPHATGTFTFMGKVNDKASRNELLVVMVTMNYTVRSVQDSVVAYATTRVDKGGNFLAGLALFGDNFWPNTLIGWLLIIIFIALLVLVARRFYPRSARPEPYYPGTFGRGSNRTSGGPDQYQPRVTRTPL